MRADIALEAADIMVTSQKIAFFFLWTSTGRSETGSICFTGAYKNLSAVPKSYNSGIVPDEICSFTHCKALKICF